MQTRSPQSPEHVPSAEPTTRPLWIPTAAGVVIAIVALAVGAMVGSVGLSDDQATDVPAFVDRWGEAFVAEDSAALAALYTGSGTFNCRAFDFTIVRSEIADVVMQDETDFTEFEPTTVLVGDEIVAVEYQIRATSPSGQEVTTPLLAVFEVDRDGLIARSMIDYDKAELFPDMFSSESEHGYSPLGCANV